MDPFTDETKQLIVQVFQAVGTSDPRRSGQWIHVDVWVARMVLKEPSLKKVVNQNRLLITLTEKFKDMRNFAPRGVNTSGIYHHSYDGSKSGPGGAAQSDDFYMVTDPSDTTVRVHKPFELTLQGFLQRYPQDGALASKSANAAQINNRKYLVRPNENENNDSAQQSQEDEQLSERERKRRKFLANLLDFWKCTEARRQFNLGAAPKDDDDDENDNPKEIMHDRIRKLSLCISNYPKWKDLLDVEDRDNPEVEITEYDVFNFRNKAIVLRRAQQIALDQMPAKTFTECCKLAVDECALFVIPPVDATTVGLWNRQLRETETLPLGTNRRKPKKVRTYRSTLLDECPDLVKSIKEFCLQRLTEGRLSGPDIHKHLCEWLELKADDRIPVVQRFKANPPIEATVTGWIKELGFVYDVKQGFNGHQDNTWRYIGDDNNGNQSEGGVGASVTAAAASTGGTRTSTPQNAARTPANTTATPTQRHNSNSSQDHSYSTTPNRNRHGLAGISTSPLQRHPNGHGTTTMVSPRPHQQGRGGYSQHGHGDAGMLLHAAEWNELLEMDRIVRGNGSNMM